MVYLYNVTFLAAGKVYMTNWQLSEAALQFQLSGCSIADFNSLVNNII